jgi:hypothetical protein
VDATTRNQKAAPAATKQIKGENLVSGIFSTYRLLFSPQESSYYPLKLNLINQDLAPLHPNSFPLRDRAILVPKSHVLPMIESLKFDLSLAALSNSMHCCEKFS